MRVVQYEMGTVITPFATSEKPIETFTGPKLTGDSKTNNLYTYYETRSSGGVLIPPQHRGV